MKQAILASCAMIVMTACATGGPTNYSSYVCTHTNFSERSQVGTDGTRYGSPWASRRLARQLTCPVPVSKGRPKNSLKVTVRMHDRHSQAAVLTTAFGVTEDGTTRRLGRKVTDGVGTGISDLVFNLSVEPDINFLHASVDLPSADGRRYSELIGFTVE
jgi:hypothetical protein